MPAEIEASGFILILMKPHPSVATVYGDDAQVGDVVYPTEATAISFREPAVRGLPAAQAPAIRRSRDAASRIDRFWRSSGAEAQHPDVHLAATANDRYVGWHRAVNKRLAALDQRDLPVKGEIAWEMEGADQGGQTLFFRFS